MRHVAACVGAMPVHRAGRAPHGVADLYPLWLAALVAHPAGAGQNLEDLAARVVVPERARARREGDVADDCVVLGEHAVEIDVAGEGGA